LNLLSGIVWNRLESVQKYIVDVLKYIFYDINIYRMVLTEANINSLKSKMFTDDKKAIENKEKEDNKNKKLDYNTIKNIVKPSTVVKK